MNVNHKKTAHDEVNGLISSYTETGHCQPSRN